jgi:hypothetical protein
MYVTNSKNTYVSNWKDMGSTSSGSTSQSTFTDLGNVNGQTKFQGRNKAAVLNNKGIPTNMTSVGAIDYVVSTSFSIKNDYIDNSKITRFCGKINSGTFSADVTYEPIYEIIVDTKTVGLYAKLSDCLTSTTTPFTKTIQVGFKIDTTSWIGTQFTMTLTGN